jgi:stage V sporulation protein B
LKKKKETFMTGVMTLIFSQIIVKVVGIVYKVYLTNREGFGDTGNAIYNGGYQIYALLLLISSIGIPNAISKLVSERVSVEDYKGAKRIFKISLAILGLIGTIGTLILFFGAEFISTKLLDIQESTITLKILSPAIVLVAISSVIRGYFNGRSQMTATAHSQSFEQILKTVFTIVIVEIAAHITSNDVVAMAAGATAATTLSVIGSFIYICKYYFNKRKTFAEEIKNSKNYEEESTKSIIKKILAISIPASLTSIVTSINKNIDSITVVRGLKKITTEENAKKLYGILSGKTDMLTALPLAFTIAFATALVPGISAAKAKGDKETIQKRIKSSYLLTMLIGLPCAFGLFTFAGPILQLIFPNASDGASVLRAVSMIIVFTTVTQTLSGSLQGLGNYRTPVIGLVIGVIVKTVLNLIIIPIEGIGIYGATSSTIICQAISYAIEMIALKKMTKIKFEFTKYYIKPLAATLIMSVLSYGSYIAFKMILPGRIATILALLLAVVIYAIAVIALNILSEDEIKELPKGDKIYRALVKVGVYK